MSDKYTLPNAEQETVNRFDSERRQLFELELERDVAKRGAGTRPVEAVEEQITLVKARIDVLADRIAKAEKGKPEG